MDNMQASYVRLYSSFDVLVRTHQITSVSSLTKAKPKNEVEQEVKEYLELLRQDSTKEDLDLSAHNMHKFIGGPVKVKIMLLMFQNVLDTRSKTIYLDAMAARFHS